MALIEGLNRPLQRVDVGVVGKLVEKVRRVKREAIGSVRKLKSVGERTSLLPRVYSMTLPQLGSSQYLCRPSLKVFPRLPFYLYVFNASSRCQPAI
jgi:hypothetical protein